MNQTKYYCSENRTGLEALADRERENVHYQKGFHDGFIEGQRKGLEFLVLQEKMKTTLMICELCWDKLKNKQDKENNK